MPEQVKPTSFKGINFIRLADIPVEYRERFLSWVPKDQIITISTKSNIYPECVLYSYYAEWIRQIRKSN